MSEIVSITSEIDFNNGTLRLADMAEPLSSYEVTFDELDLQNYSWQNCPLTWDEANFIWDEAGAVHRYIDVKSSLSLSDIDSKNVVKPLTGDVRVLASFGRNAVFVRTTDEAVKAMEQHSKQASFDRSVAEATVVKDASSRLANFKRTSVETAKITSGIDRQAAFSRNVAETVEANESYSKAVKFKRASNENLTVGEVLKRYVAFVRNTGDVLNVYPAIAKTVSFYRQPSETVKTTENNRMAMAVRLADAFGIEYKNYSGYALNHTHSLKFSESKRAFSLVRGFAEVFGMSETYWDNISFFISSAETFTISESSSRKNVFDRTLNDYLHLAEALSNDLAFKLNDSFVVKDALKRSTSYKRSSSEQFGFTETSMRKVNQVLSDVLGTGDNLERPALAKGFYDFIDVKDAFRWLIGMNHKESFGAASSFAKQVDFNRTPKETLGVAEYERKDLSVKHFEDVNADEMASKLMERGFEEDAAISDWHNKSLSVVKADSVMMVDGVTKSAKAALYDVLGVDDGNNNKVDVAMIDGFVVVDFNTKGMTSEHSDTLAFKDERKSAVKMSKADSFGIDSGYFNGIGYAGNETFGVQDYASKNILHALTDEVLLVDLLANNMKHYVEEEPFGATDEYDRQVNYVRIPVDSLMIVDGVTKRASHVIQDWILVRDEFARIALFARAIAEKFSVAETYWDNIMFYLQVVESCVVADEIAKGLGKPVGDKLTIGELLKKHSEVLQEERTVGIAEELFKRVVFERTPKEAIGVEDRKLGSKIVSLIADAVKFKELIGKSFERSPFFETVALSEIGNTSTNFVRKHFEALNVYELGFNKNVGKKSTDTLWVRELLGKDFLRDTFREVFAVGDVNIHSMHYFRGGDEAFSIVDKKLGSNIGKKSYEDLIIAESLSKILQTSVKELLICDDEIGRQVIFSLVLKEALNVAEHRYKYQKVVIKDELGVADNIKKRIEKLSPEAFVIIDNFLREFIARRIIGEAVTVEDYLSKGVGLLMSEEMNTYDTLIKACDGILSNISVKEGELTLDEFLEIVNKPPNYTKFIEFKVGEYEYQEALVRIIMATKVRQTQPIASAVVMHVDIPDTDDKGEVEITDTTAPTKVYFNKFYYNPPSVNVTLKGGNTADGVLIPNVVSTEYQDDHGRYFEVELWDENWSERKTGKIYWVSKGY